MKTVHLLRLQSTEAEKNCSGVYKMLWPHRRDAEQERLKESSFHREDSLLADLGTTLTKTRSKVLELVSTSVSRLSYYSENFIPQPAVFKEAFPHHTKQDFSTVK